MADYINREELLKTIDEGVGDTYAYQDGIVDLINEIDAVEVVRCKDCKHRQEGVIEDICVRYKNDIGGWFVVNDDDYCKWGEKE